MSHDYRIIIDLGHISEAGAIKLANLVNDEVVGKSTATVSLERRDYIPPIQRCSPRYGDEWEDVDYV